MVQSVIHSNKTLYIVIHPRDFSLKLIHRLKIDRRKNANSSVGDEWGGEGKCG